MGGGTGTGKTTFANALLAVMADRTRYPLHGPHVGTAGDVGRSVGMRRRYTSKQREQLIEAVRASGESVRAVAKRMGVTVSTPYPWMKETQRPSAPQFARLIPEPRATSTSLVVRVGSAAIRVDQGFDAELLRTVVCALSTRPTSSGRTYGDDAVARVPPFEQIELAVERIFLSKRSDRRRTSWVRDFLFSKIGALQNDRRPRRRARPSIVA